MAQVINTNVASLNAQRNLYTSESAMKIAMQRLSSGLRINSAKDDAAGQAISERMTAQIRGMNQAVRNANDGISLLQTGEGALNEISNNLQRIRELALQATNATNTTTDRASIDAEVQQRLTEIDRIATQTSFNGQKILEGTFGTAAFQVGANVGESISISLTTSMRTTALGKTADYVNGTTQYDSTKALGIQGTGVDVANALASGDLSIAVGGATYGVGASTDYSAGAGNAGRTASSAYSKAQAINSVGIPGVTATADTTVTFDFTQVTTTNTAYSLSINNVSIYSGLNTSATGRNTALTGNELAAAINSNAASTGVTASFDSANNRMTLAASDGRNIDLSQTTTSETGTGLTTTSNTLNSTANDAKTMATTASGDAVEATFGGTIRLTSTDPMTLGGNNEAYIGYANNSTMAVGSSALNSASVTTVANANTAITRIDAAITAVNNLRGNFGAVQNRFDSVIANLQTTSENLSASRSRIRDADFAAETAELSRAQILQQAGTAMLAQANASTNSVLTLLRGG